MGPLLPDLVGQIFNVWRSNPCLQSLQLETANFYTAHEILRAGTKRCWRNAGLGERCCRGKDVAEKEPEDVAVVLPSSKRHCTTFNTALYPKTHQTRDLSLQMMMSVGARRGSRFTCYRVETTPRHCGVLTWTCYCQFLFSFYSSGRGALKWCHHNKNT